MFLRIIIFIAVLNIFHSKITDPVWETIEKKLENDIPITVEVMNSVKRVLQHKDLDNFDVEEILGRGSFGILFSAKNRNQEPVSIKVHLEQDIDFEKCQKLDQLSAEFQSMKYMIKIQEVLTITLPKETIEIKTKNGGVEFKSVPKEYFCVLIMDTGSPMSSLFFTANELFLTEEMKKENTKKMIRFIVRLLDAYRALHFEAGYYHLDVKPDNLLYVITIPDGEYEPRIIDFDHTFKRTGDKAYLPFPLYLKIYRPPEWRSKRGAHIKHIPKSMHYQYSLSTEFKEEAYVVGETIIFIISNNQYYLDVEDENLKKLKEIVRAMTNKNQDLRISTKEAHERALLLLAQNNILIEAKQNFIMII